MERREYHRQLEQCGYRRLRRRPRQTWRRYFPLSARTDRLDRVRTRNPSEGHPRRHSRLRVCAYSKESGAKRLYELLRSAYRHELDRLDSRPQCLGSCAAAIRPTTQSALSHVGSPSGCLQSSTTNAGEEFLSVRRRGHGFYRQGGDGKEDFKFQERNMTKCDVAVIGAGAYGLSATAHLRTVKGLDVRTFGEPMSFWERNMPVGMLLRSGWAATHLADPDQALTLEKYQAASSRRFSTPVPLDCFIDYGRWFQRQVAPDLDRRKIVQVEPKAKGFRLILETGETVIAGRVVVAAGIGSFAWRPAEFAGLHSSLVSHTSEHRELRKFA